MPSQNIFRRVLGRLVVSHPRILALRSGAEASLQPVEEGLQSFGRTQRLDVGDDDVGVSGDRDPDFVLGPCQVVAVVPPVQRDDPGCVPPPCDPLEWIRRGVVFWAARPASRGPEELLKLLGVKWHPEWLVGR